MLSAVWPSLLTFWKPGFCLQQSNVVNGFWIKLVIYMSAKVSFCLKGDFQRLLFEISKTFLPKLGNCSGGLRRSLYFQCLLQDNSGEQQVATSISRTNYLIGCSLPSPNLEGPSEMKLTGVQFQSPTCGLDILNRDFCREAPASIDY